MIQIATFSPLVHLAGSINGDHLKEGIELTLIGMLVVFIALLAILGLLLILKKSCSSDRSNQMASSVANKADVGKNGGAGSDAPIGSDAIDPAVMAVIIGAVAVAVGQPVRVRSVKIIRNETGSAWSGRGRTSIQSSHRMRKGIK